MRWFHHDTDMHRNRKIRKLIRTHGATGFALWCLLLEKLYAQEGDFNISADQLWFEDISEDLKLGDYRTPIRILDTLAELQLIDVQLWQEHIIYAPGLKARVEYIEALPRRIRGLRPLSRGTAHRKHRDLVFNRDGFQCVYCGTKETLTLDHVIPYSKGGSDEPENLSTCCQSCNSKKHARTPEEWRGEV
jgi:hypothetical protein